MLLAAFVADASSDNIREIACGNGRVTIRCSPGSVIRILRAFYGRVERDKCLDREDAGRVSTENFLRFYLLKKGFINRKIIKITDTHD